LLSRRLAASHRPVIAANADIRMMLIGATAEGKKELVGFQTGVRESAQSWRELLVDIKRRGLEIAPDLAIGNRALGCGGERRSRPHAFAGARSALG
jgi:Transposase, Mutator family